MSQVQLVPYLTFNGKSREALSFYQQCLGGELQMSTFGESPMAAQMPAEAQQLVMHASLTNGPLVLMASDANPEFGGQVTAGSMVTLSLHCTSREQIADWFGRLSADGQVTMPLQDTFWNATFGMFNDKFGIPWMLNFDHDPHQQ